LNDTPNVHLGNVKLKLPRFDILMIFFTNDCLELFNRCVKKTSQINLSTLKILLKYVCGNMEIKFSKPTFLLRISCSIFGFPAWISDISLDHSD